MKAHSETRFENERMFFEKWLILIWNDCVPPRIWNDRVPQGICKWLCATRNLRWPCATENLRWPRATGNLRWPCATINLKWPCATENLKWLCATFIFHPFPMNRLRKFSKKCHKNQAIRFSSFFMKFCPISWKITKIGFSVYHQFSWPRGHEKSQKSGALFFINFQDPAVMKIQINQAQTVKPHFWSISIIDPGTWIFKKISNFNFAQFP